MGRRRKTQEIPKPDCSLCHNFAKAVGRMDGGAVRMCPAVNRYVSGVQSPGQCDHYQLYRWVWCPKEHHRINIYICAGKCVEKCAMRVMAKAYQYGPESEELPKPDIISLQRRPVIRRPIIRTIAAPTPTVPTPKRRPIIISNRVRKPIPTGGVHV